MRIKMALEPLPKEIVCQIEPNGWDTITGFDVILVYRQLDKRQYHWQLQTEAYNRNTFRRLENVNECDFQCFDGVNIPIY